MEEWINITPVQAKFFKAVMDIVKADPDLINFVSLPATGKTYILKAIDKYFDGITQLRFDKSLNSNTMERYFNILEQSKQVNPLLSGNCDEKINQ